MRLLAVCALLLAAAPARAASASPVPTKPSTATAAAPATPPASALPGAPVDASSTTTYSYNAEGRRDPFQSLTGTGGDSKAVPRPTIAGIAGIRIDDVSVRGIMQSRERLVAMVQGPDNRTYLIHQGDKLADGLVKSITPVGVVLVQDVSDPRAKEKTREVRKPLRTLEDDKE
jgi:Tfp pilus assembly protein PilP